MKKLFAYLAAAFILLLTSNANAQTPMQLNGLDCNGVNHNLYADLDSGKAVVLFFWMPSCSSCPPPALKIQQMVNNVMTSHPGKVTGYAMPFNNTATCTTSANWVTSNALPFFMPYDSGATQVAHYGGFGMPTVVLLGGKGTNKHAMFSTLSFATSDTTIMRDSILALLATAPNSINELPSNINAVDVYPNPSNKIANIAIDISETSNLQIEILDIYGKSITTICNDHNQKGKISKTIATDALAAGVYFIRINTNGKYITRKLNVVH